MSELSQTISGEVLSVIDNIGKICHSQIYGISRVTGLSEIQVIILREIQRKSPINITNLIKTIHLSQYRMNVQIEYLIHKNFVLRERDTIDKRSWNLTLSEKGESLLNSAEIVRQKLMFKFNNLPSEDQEQYLNTLQQFTELIED